MDHKTTTEVVHKRKHEDENPKAKRRKQSSSSAPGASSGVQTTAGVDIQHMQKLLFDALKQFALKQQEESMVEQENDTDDEKFVKAVASLAKGAINPLLMLSSDDLHRLSGIPSETIAKVWKVTKRAADLVKNTSDQYSLLFDWMSSMDGDLYRLVCEEPETP